MSKFGEFSERALQLAETAAEKLQGGKSQVGTLVTTSAALTAARTGAKVALGFARRHPVVAAASVAGAGVLAFAAYRRRQQAKHGPIEVKARRVPAQTAADAEVVAPEAASGAAEH